jgi:hypothetical protein
LFKLISREIFPLTSRRRRCALLAASVLLLAAPAGAALPSGTFVDARLLTPISSYSTKAGTPIEVQVTTPVCSDTMDLPKGAIIRGVVSRIHRVGLGLVHETAGMQLEFREFQMPDGRKYPVSAQLLGIENARERVDKHGSIHGIRATETLSNRVGERLALATLGHPFAMIPLFVIETSMFHFPDPEIVYGRGAELHLSVAFPEELGLVSRCAVAEQIPLTEWTELHNVVDVLPYWTYSLRQPQPIDLVNLVFAGSEDEVSRAFAAAGWGGSKANSMREGVKAIRAIAEEHALADAPMRTLLLDGEEPDLRLQKSLNTFCKRDHLRVWKRSETLNGRSVWASAATRDIGATFAIHPFGFTHRIQDDVDQERDEVVSDLVFTGCVDSVAYVSRPDTVRSSGLEFRRGVITDSRVAVVTLNSCQQPDEVLFDTGSLAKPGRAVRWIRRVTLTARNHFMRDNIYWRTADAVRLTFRTVGVWKQEHRNEVLARKNDERLAAEPALRKDYALALGGR